MPIRSFAAVQTAFTLFTAMAATSLDADEPPNIIFILTDDQGWGDLGSYHHPYLRTPHLDQLAREGTVFEQFYVNSPVCSPSRTAFMTGHFPARHGVHGHFWDTPNNRRRNMPDWLDPHVTTVCDLVKQAGYVTAHYGKWHLGSTDDAPDPGAYGLDDYRTRTVARQGPPFEQGQDKYFRANSTGLIVDEAVQFIEDHKDQPFYINLWTLVPHAELEPTPEELAVYGHLQPDPDHFQHYMPEYLRRATDLESQMRIYCAAVTGLDKAIGRLLDYLDANDLAETTLVVFSSDNGPEDYHLSSAKNAGVGSTGPLRGRKRSIYEGGLRTPLIIRWPGRVPAGRVETRSVLTGVDWLPTVCALAGVRVPPHLHPDGEDVSDILQGGSRLRRRPILWEWRYHVIGDPAYAPPGLAIRDGDWKLLVEPDGSGAELYNIPQDPSETINLADQHRELTARLTERLLKWQQTLP